MTDEPVAPAPSPMARPTIQAQRPARAGGKRAAAKKRVKKPIAGHSGRTAKVVIRGHAAAPKPKG